MDEGTTFFFIKRGKRIKILNQKVKSKIILHLQEVSEFKKLLKYFNDDYAPAVCIYTVVNISWAVSGTAWLWNYDTKNDTDFTYVSIINVILWISISIAPFIQVNLLP